MKKVISLIVLVLVIAACAPAASSTEVIQSFRATSSDGTQVTKTATNFVYDTATYTLTVSFDQQFVEYSLLNKSSGVIRLIFDESVIVLPSGISSRAIPGTASYATRNDPQPPSIIASGTTGSGSLVPADNLNFYSGSGGGLVISDMFSFPPSPGTTFRLLLAIEVDGQRQNADITFTS